MEKPESKQKVSRITEQSELRKLKAYLSPVHRQRKLASCQLQNLSVHGGALRQPALQKRAHLPTGARPARVHGKHRERQRARRRPIARDGAAHNMRASPGASSLTRLGHNFKQLWATRPKQVSIQLLARDQEAAA
jgi:hypothetical protein